MNEIIKLYEVGGCIRDQILGEKSKDIDYSVEAVSYEAMRDYIASRGIIYLETPDKFTIRGNLPGIGAADFVLCRKEGPYSDRRRPDWVKIGTLMDDLARRDFTMNAIAKGEDGVLIDPFDGQVHIRAKLITCVGRAEDRLMEDSLRMLRAIRFHITKKFTIHPDIEACLASEQYLKWLGEMAIERVREELIKMFECDTRRTLHCLTQVYPGVGATIFDNKRLWLKPSLREAE